MKKIFSILFLSVLLLSCGNKKRYTISDVEKFNKQWEEKHRQVDNVKKDEGKNKTEVLYLSHFQDQGKSYSIRFVKAGYKTEFIDDKE